MKGVISSVGGGSGGGMGSGGDVVMSESSGWRECLWVFLQDQIDLSMKHCFLRSEMAERILLGESGS